MWRHLLILIPASFLLSGCIFSGSAVINAEIPTGNVDENGQQETVTKPIELDRWGAHTLIRIEEEKTARALIAAEKEDNKPPAEPQRKEDIQVILDSPEAIQAWANVETVRSMSQVNTNLSMALRNCVAGKKTHGLDLSRSKAPKGVVAETVTSLTDGTAKVLGTPAVKVAATLLSGAALVDSAKADQPTTSVDAGGDVKFVTDASVISEPVTTTTEVLQPAALE